MDRSIRRRLDVLIVLCSGLLGILLVSVGTGDRAGLLVLLYALFPTGLVLLLAFWYVEAAPASPPVSEEQADS